MTTPLSSRHDAFSPSRSGGGDDVGSDRLEQFIDRHPGVVKFARVGWAAKGVVYLLIGVLAFAVAANPFDTAGSSDSSSGQADPSGAVSTIAQQSYGRALLWTLAVGLFLYAIWRLVTVFLPARVDAHAILRRIGYTVSAATYVLLGLSAVSLARRPGSSGGSGGQSQDSQVTKATRAVMEWTGGQWIVGLAGIAIVAIGVYFFWKGVSCSFENQLEHRGVGPFSWDVVRTMGRVGWIGRAVMMGLIGVGVTVAAVQFDPNEAQGLDDSLRRVADDTLGTILVLIVAVGLTLYGAYCIVSTPSRKLVASDDDSVG